MGCELAKFCFLLESSLRSIRIEDQVALVNWNFMSLLFNSCV